MRKLRMDNCHKQKHKKDHSENINHDEPVRFWQQWENSLKNVDAKTVMEIFVVGRGFRENRQSGLGWADSFFVQNTPHQ